LDNKKHEQSEKVSAGMDPLQRHVMSSALKHQSEHYPVRYEGKVPRKVKMRMSVKSDIPFSLGGGLFARVDQEYYVSVNSHGAVTAILPNGRMLGLKPREFKVIEFH